MKNKSSNSVKEATCNDVLNAEVNKPVEKMPVNNRGRVFSIFGFILMVASLLLLITYVALGSAVKNHEIKYVVACWMALAVFFIGGAGITCCSFGIRNLRGLSISGLIISISTTLVSFIYFISYLVNL